MAARPPPVKPLHPRTFATLAGLRLLVASLIQAFEEFKFEIDDEAAVIRDEAVEQLEALLREIRKPAELAKKPVDSKTTPTERLAGIVNEYANAYLEIIEQLKHYQQKNKKKPEDEIANA